MGGKDRGPVDRTDVLCPHVLFEAGMCGTEITEFVARKTRDRVRLGPGTLYTLLGKFQERA